MAPGFAKTSTTAREMYVPTHATEQERVVRAHEMMHAKVSPGETWLEWVARGVASERALVAAEEFRVNELLRRQGFDTARALRDGSERYTGERIGAEQLWAEGIFMTAAFAGTARFRPFVTGVRRQRPLWADSFRALAARLRAFAGKVPTTDLASTRTDQGLAPAGFAHTEAWAVILDHLAGPVPDGHRTRHLARTDRGWAGTDGESASGVEGTHAPFDAAAIKRMKPPRGRASSASALLVPWVPLRPMVATLDRLAPGGLGKQRRASDRGRHPRRIHRTLTDPHKRIFDATKRGTGGVVLVDVSGSMSLGTQDVLRIAAAAPGAIVATYSANSRLDPEPNLWVVAEKGRMASSIPPAVGGNGCDGPALDWAIRRRQHPKAPIVWVCDGIVTGEGDRLSESLTLECIKKVLTHRITMTPDVDAAVAAFKVLAAGGHPARWLPDAFEECWAKVTGGSLHRS